MKQIKLSVPEYVYTFYANVAKQAKRSPEQVMADALFKLAGELSLNALHKKKSSTD